MPYYRIIIWTKKRPEPFTGIRVIENHNINSVFIMTKNKAESTFGWQLIDVEVQMLSKLCFAVKNHLINIEKKREEKRMSNGLNTPDIPNRKRRD